MNEFRPMAQRIVNAENRFIAWARETAGLSEGEAERVLSYYRRHRLVKIDPVTGQFNLKHGAFAAADVLRRAATATRPAGTMTAATR